MTTTMMIVTAHGSEDDGDHDAQGMAMITVVAMLGISMGIMEIISTATGVGVDGVMDIIILQLWADFLMGNQYYSMSILEI